MASVPSTSAVDSTVDSNFAMSAGGVDLTSFLKGWVGGKVGVAGDNQDLHLN